MKAVLSTQVLGLVYSDRQSEQDWIMKVIKVLHVIWMLGTGNW
jgi:hypothetical protein